MPCDETTRKSAGGYVVKPDKTGHKHGRGDGRLPEMSDSLSWAQAAGGLLCLIRPIRFVTLSFRIAWQVHLTIPPVSSRFDL